MFDEYEWKKYVKTACIKNIEQCSNCYQYEHMDKMSWEKMMCEYSVKKYKSNECEIDFNQHSIKCVLCGKKHMTWSFKCLKRRKKKNKITIKNTKTTKLYIIKTIRSEPQQSLNTTKNIYSACNNTINKKNPSDWKTVMKKKRIKTDNSFECFDVVKMTTIQINSMRLDFEKKPQNFVKKSVNHLKKLMQSSQTMFVNTQSKDFRFSTNRMMFDVF